jgi:hypothetical protein
LVKRGTCKHNERLQIGLICLDMGWTYQEYMDQPLWLIQFITDKKRVDYYNQKLNSKQNGN